MQFAVGYQVMSGEPDYFSDIVADYRDHVQEVYFAWPGEASGREPVAAEHVEQVRDELRRIQGMGVRLNLLFNASCYGAEAASAKFAKQVATLAGEVAAAVGGLATATTMSPVAARALKEAFPELDVRASVNMRLGTVAAMRYVADRFDSYNVQREYNRDPARLRELQAWAQANGKRLWVLANSGCLNFCAVQTFHDNLVAHGRDSGFIPLCREHFTSPDRRVDFLRGSWIRPEDLAKHRAIFAGDYKLATRRHDQPRLVIDAYARGKHYGNLLDLMEPGFAPQWHPFVVDNAAFPADWFERVTSCDHACAESCDYCQQVAAAVFRKVV